MSAALSKRALVGGGVAPVAVTDVVVAVAPALALAWGVGYWVGLAALVDLIMGIPDGLECLCVPIKDYSFRLGFLKK